jgi:hypothetical protein
MGRHLLINSVRSGQPRGEPVLVSLLPSCIQRSIVFSGGVQRPCHSVSRLPECCFSSACCSRQLKEHAFVAGDCSIADIAIWPWVSRYEWQTVDLNQYPDGRRCRRATREGCRRRADTVAGNSPGNKQRSGTHGEQPFPKFSRQREDRRDARTTGLECGAPYAARVPPSVT